jgi:hypothetical protein
MSKCVKSINGVINEKQLLNNFELHDLMKAQNNIVNEIGVHLLKFSNEIIQLNNGIQILFWRINNGEIKDDFVQFKLDYYMHKRYDAYEDDEKYYLVSPVDKEKILETFDESKDEDLKLFFMGLD